MAAGVSVKPGRLDAFRERINEIARHIITPDMFQPPLKLDAETDLSELTLVHVEKMRQLEPLGQGNPEIQLLIGNLTRSSPVYRMGRDKQHAKFWVTDERSACEVIAWNLKPEDEPENNFDIAVAPQINEFNGRKTIQLKFIYYYFIFFQINFIAHFIFFTKLQMGYKITNAKNKIQCK